MDVPVCRQTVKFYRVQTYKMKVQVVLAFALCVCAIDALHMSFDEVRRACSHESRSCHAYASRGMCQVSVKRSLKRILPI